LIADIICAKSASLCALAADGVASAIPIASAVTAQLVESRCKIVMIASKKLLETAPRGNSF
jgi:hypothetical protein